MYYDIDIENHVIMTLTIFSKILQVVKLSETGNRDEFRFKACIRLMYFGIMSQIYSLYDMNRYMVD